MKPSEGVTDPAIARSLELQRRGYRVVVQQEKGEVTVYLGKREAPIAADVKGTAGTFAVAIEAAERVETTGLGQKQLHFTGALPKADRGERRGRVEKERRTCGQVTRVLKGMR